MRTFLKIGCGCRSERRHAAGYDYSLLEKEERKQSKGLQIVQVGIQEDLVLVRHSFVHSTYLGYHGLHRLKSNAHMILKYPDPDYVVHITHCCFQACVVGLAYVEAGMNEDKKLKTE